MLKISVRQIDNDGMDFSGTATPEILDLDLKSKFNQDVKFEAPIDYFIHISLVSGGILVAGTLSTKVKCNCGRCLEDFDLDAKNIEVCHFHENYTGYELDIAPALREDILINLPMKFICKENCTGIDYEKSHNSTLKAAEKELDSEKDPWKGLEGLKL